MNLKCWKQYKILNCIFVLYQIMWMNFLMGLQHVPSHFVCFWPFFAANTVEKKCGIWGAYARKMLVFRGKVSIWRVFAPHPFAAKHSGKMWNLGSLCQGNVSIWKEFLILRVFAPPPPPFAAKQTGKKCGFRKAYAREMLVFGGKVFNLEEILSVLYIKTLKVWETWLARVLLSGK